MIYIIVVSYISHISFSGRRSNFYDIYYRTTYRFRWNRTNLYRFKVIKRQSRGTRINEIIVDLVTSNKRYILLKDKKRKIIKI